MIEKLNCTRQQMFDAIEEAKQAVRDQKANRLIVTILTHGEEVSVGLHVLPIGLLMHIILLAKTPCIQRKMNE